MTKRDQPLEKELEEALQGIDEREQVLKVLERWSKPSVKGKGLVRTKDGSFTLISERYGEPYHSLTAGAITECLEKFIEPSELLKKAQGAKVISVVDVGFGLGYNLTVLLKKLRDLSKGVYVRIISFEKELPEEPPAPPEEYRAFWSLLWENLPKFEKEGIHFELLLGDARREVQKSKDFQADAILHDAFSPYKNPELWSLEFLKELVKLLKPDGVWVSYTSSLAVRKALRILGLRLQSTVAVGRRSSGTRAGFLMEENLPEKELSRLENSPYAIPFLDPNLERKPLHILVDYALRVVYNMKKEEVVL
ncbi:tRNA (5-methylaminomethyl-2-thiouridine)(34)-methyltransferase MnmD [Thermocrinis sp.]